MKLPGDLLLPHYQLGAVDSSALPMVAVLPAVAGALGLIGTTATGLDFAVCAASFELPEVRNVVIVMCDGLGYLNLEQHRAYAPYLRARWADILATRTTFPSTTAAALSSFGTGTAPGLTGMVGYTVRVPDSGLQTKGGTGILANLVSWTQQRDPTVIAGPSGNKGAATFGVPPQDFQREPSLLGVLEQHGVEVLSAGPDKFAASGLTQAAFSGGQFQGSQTLSGRVKAVQSFIRKPTSRPKCAYLYWGDVDKQGHGHGPDSREWTDALAHFDYEFEGLVGGLPAGTLVVLVADHGQIAVDRSSQIDVAAVPTLARGVALVGGEARALHVYAYDPRLPRSTTADPATDIALRWRDYLGDRAIVWTRAEAITAGLFGPKVSAHVKPWVGDVVVACTGASTIVDSRTQTANSLELKGVHGSLTPTEMTVPLLVTLT